MWLYWRFKAVELAGSRAFWLLRGVSHLCVLWFPWERLLFRSPFPHRVESHVLTCFLNVVCLSSIHNARRKKSWADLKASGQQDSWCLYIFLTKRSIFQNVPYSSINLIIILWIYSLLSDSFLNFFTLLVHYTLLCWGITEWKHTHYSCMTDGIEVQLRWQTAHNIQLICTFPLWLQKSVREGGGCFRCKSLFFFFLLIKKLTSHLASQHIWQKVMA